MRRLFSRLQILSAMFMACSHRSNDAQKFMGAFALTLYFTGALAVFRVPLWVVLLCAAVMGICTAVGVSRIIRTLGVRITHLESVHGLAAETGAAIVIEITRDLMRALNSTFLTPLDGEDIAELARARDEISGSPSSHSVRGTKP